MRFLSFRRVWNLSEEIQKALTDLAEAYPRGTQCCLNCEFPKEDRTLDKECGICFDEERCGCIWCKYYSRGLHRCRISLKMDQLRRGGLGWLFELMDYAENDKPAGRWVEVQLIKFFPRETFLIIINAFKRYGLKFDEEMRSWGKEFKDDRNGYCFFEKIYKELTWTIETLGVDL